MQYCEKLKSALGERVLIDDSNKKPQDKKWEWIKKGAPIRIEVGNKEVDSNNVFYVVRTDVMNKNISSFDEFVNNYNSILNNIQNNLLENNKKHLFNNTITVNNIDEISDIFENSTKFVAIDKNLWKNEELEKIMEKYSLSYRNMPFEMEGKVIIGKSY